MSKVVRPRSNRVLPSDASGYDPKIKRGREGKDEIKRLRAQRKAAEAAEPATLPILPNPDNDKDDTSESCVVLTGAAGSSKTFYAPSHPAAQRAKDSTVPVAVDTATLTAEALRKELETVLAQAQANQLAQALAQTQAQIQAQATNQNNDALLTTRTTSGAAHAHIKPSKKATTTQNHQSPVHGTSKNNPGVTHTTAHLSEDLAANPKNVVRSTKKSNKPHHARTEPTTHRQTAADTHRPTMSVSTDDQAAVTIHSFQREKDTKNKRNNTENRSRHAANPNPRSTTRTTQNNRNSSAKTLRPGPTSLNELRSQLHNVDFFPDRPTLTPQFHGADINNPDPSRDYFNMDQVPDVLSTYVIDNNNPEQKHTSSAGHRMVESADGITIMHKDDKTAPTYSIGLNQSYYEAIKLLVSKGMTEFEIDHADANTLNTIYTFLAQEAKALGTTFDIALSQNGASFTPTPLPLPGQPATQSQEMWSTFDQEFRDLFEDDFQQVYEHNQPLVNTYDHNQRMSMGAGNHNPGPPPPPSGGTSSVGYRPSNANPMATAAVGDPTSSRGHSLRSSLAESTRDPDGLSRSASPDLSETDSNLSETDSLVSPVPNPRPARPKVSFKDDRLARARFFDENTAPNKVANMNSVTLPKNDTQKLAQMGLFAGDSANQKAQTRADFAQKVKTPKRPTDRSPQSPTVKVKG